MTIISVTKFDQAANAAWDFSCACARWLKKGIANRSKQKH